MRGSMSRALMTRRLLSAVVCCCSVVLSAQEPSNDEANAPAPSQAVADTSVEQGETTDPTDLKAARFLGVTPGETTLAEVKEKLGNPDDEQGSGSDTVLEYRVGPFPKIEIFLTDNVVVSVLAQLNESRDPTELAEELGLDRFTPVAVTNGDEMLGIAYPERGVLFSYAAGAARPRVTQLVLEPLSAEMFLLRFEATPIDHYTQRLEDLERILDIDPRNAEALWLGAKLLATTGDHDDAVKLVKQAVRLSPNNDRFQLTQAKFTARAGDYQGSVAAVKRLLDRPDLTAIIRARAEVEYGDLMASGLKRDYQAAVEHHLAAVKAATPLVSDPDRQTRQEAERILIDAYLGTANDIARGTWDRKSEVVPKWCLHAEELAAGFVQNGGADPTLPLLVWRRSLEAYAGMDAEVIDTQAIVEAAQHAGQALIEESDDELFQQYVQWELLQTNFAGVQVAHARGRYSEALKYAGEASRLADALPADRAASSQARYLIGRLYFYIGSVYAINHKDHAEAVRWFERALPRFDEGLPKSELYDTGIHGERFVSMGVSYFRAELADEALRLTEFGLDLMERAAKVGLLEERALAVPYANLAEMHRAGGRSDKAEEFTAKIARLKADMSQR